MRNSKKAYEKIAHAMMEEKTRLLTQAQALGDLGMEEAALPLWREVAGREERLAPFLAALGRDREAAIHRISAASCYERVEEYARAANLYQAALSGPLLESTRQEVNEMLARCLTRLISSSGQTGPVAPRGFRKGVVPT